MIPNQSDRSLIDSSKIDEFLNKEILSNLDQYAKLAKSFTFAFPLNFENEVEELTLIGLIALLDFGGQYDPVLYAQNSRSEFDTIRSLVFSLYLSSSSASLSSSSELSPKWLSTATPPSLAQHMRLSIVTERPHPTLPGITVGEQGGPVLGFVLDVAGRVNRAGSWLVSKGYKSIGEWIKEGVSTCGGDVDKFVQWVTAIQGSKVLGDDGSERADSEIMSYRQALRLALMLGPKRFSSSGDPFQHVPAPPHDALATALVQLGIVEFGTVFGEGVGQIRKRLDEALSSATIPGSGDEEAQTKEQEKILVWVEVTPEEHAQLWAGSVLACLRMAERATVLEPESEVTIITAAGLSAWFAARAEKGHHWTSSTIAAAGDRASDGDGDGDGRYPRIVVAIASPKEN
ncbi:hypothetical protein DL93DRAFT_2103185 [Clavulina sp. PMI_390]|nr:hypothetical protein DL93DRAFT_2103185 [Clavulina sp. PMI_390]